MEAFIKHTGIVSTLDTANVDTDQIIAKQFLKSIKRTGFGDQLFYDWRYDEKGNLRANFSLNKPEFKGTSILVARNNFGCGSSREHAVWAVAQYGYRAIIAPSKGEGENFIPGFADIFKNNCVKNGVLTIQLNEKEVDTIFKIINQAPGSKATINLEKQSLMIHGREEQIFHFEVDNDVKKRLIGGLDDIGLSLEKEKDITLFEKNHNSQILV
jgi:3-isopropylmalate/(R)-2-methylmalate dehydratase small subunit